MKRNDYVYDFSKLPEMLTVEIVANALQCSETKVHNIIRSGNLKCLKDGKLFRIRKQSFLDYVERMGA